ncbi:cytochrome C peroxidase [Emiliania huxleyi CCMP1516]|uniref:Plant heme peroxidase family profile domain-containing protein n=2 Tax=Emiliania huxleyi TaxID=2903 RepID=A0A0D3K4J5_EMIH1|nr:cytochrome C peroxidase [Emiliania huxleyi CCMP1516]EOD30680.1 cytochrome C peroxidase [Emiliania huxleyi CCMP1516]|eukprot:XP_005783109.1 cytochrome C peroxidase [Emiliania huxleyi CCMP1516]
MLCDWKGHLTASLPISCEAAPSWDEDEGALKKDYKTTREQASPLNPKYSPFLQWCSLCRGCSLCWGGMRGGGSEGCERGRGSGAHRLAPGAAVTSRSGAVGGSSAEACRSAAPPTAPLPSRRVEASRGRCRWCGGGAAFITPTPTVLTNGYYALLLSLPWTLKEWDGPMQFEDPSGKLMMLPSDIALIQDKKMRQYVQMYAKDKELFFKEFAAAFQKLEELGTKNPQTVALA